MKDSVKDFDNNPNRGKLCTLYVVRHGRTVWNAKNLMQGQADSPLDDEGISQARQIRELLKETDLNAVFTSDLGRAIQTAEEIIQNRHGLVIETLEALRERSYGIHEGRLVSDYQASMQSIWDGLKGLSEEKRRSFQPPDGIESDKQIMDRFVPCIRNIAKSYLDKTVLVVTHGAVLRNFLIFIGYKRRVEFPPSGSIPNGAYVKLVSDGIDFLVIEFKSP